MLTRSSPNRELLNRLAEQVGIEDFHSMPKDLLFNQLKEQYNFDRLLRVEKRSLRVHKGEGVSPSASTSSKKRKVLRRRKSSSSSSSIAVGTREESEEKTEEEEEAALLAAAEAEASPGTRTTTTATATNNNSMGSRLAKEKSHQHHHSSSSSSALPPTALFQVTASSATINPGTTSNGQTAKKIHKLNTMDPIMLTPINTKKKTFKFIRPNGSIVQFNVDTLIDFLITSGDFTEPETRLPFSDEQLKEIDALNKENGFNKPSVYDAKRNYQFYSDAKFRRDALLGLERCAGEVVVEMLELIEEGDPEEGQMQLAMREFPSFVDYFRQIRDVDREYASKCVAHWKLFLSGPPNHPVQDECGLLQLVLHFLKSCDEGKY